jgi:hypothetical protein
MGGEVLVQQGVYAHPFQLGQQQRDVIDTLAENAPSLGHAESGSPCLKPLEIWANRELLLSKIMK